MMQLRPGRCNSPRRKKARDTIRMHRNVSGMVAMMLFIIAAALICIGATDLHRRNKIIDAEISKIEGQIQHDRREIERLEIRLSKLETWDNVSAGMKRFGLKLHSAGNGQVIRIRYYTPQQAARIYNPPRRVARVSARRRSVR